MLGFDLNTDVETLENYAKSGGLVPEGNYHVRLAGAKTVTSKQKGLPGHELHFEILGGPSTGQEVKETLWEAGADSTDKQRTAANNRLLIFGLRLGLLRKKADGKIEFTPGKQDFSDVIGAEAIIEVKHEEYKKEDGGKGKSAKVPFTGIHYLTDPIAKTAVKGSSAAGVTPSKSSKVNTADL